jgi:shikimate kinase
MLVFLIGYRGTGKSTVARLLAMRLGYEWMDADVEIELLAGKSIAAIFADEGEPVFREMESQVVAELARRENIVIALGGGAVLRAENRRAIAAGTVIWLKASVETILERLAGDPATLDRRPNLTTQGGRDEVLKLLAEREPIYRVCANFEVDTDNKDPFDIADEILAHLR